MMRAETVVWAILLGASPALAETAPTRTPFVVQDLLTKPLREVAVALFGPEGASAVARRQEVALPDTELAGLTIFFKPRPTSYPELCSVRLRSRSLFAGQRFKEVYISGDPLSPVFATEAFSEEMRYFHESIGGCDVLRTKRFELFTAPSDEVAARGIRWLREAIDASKLSAAVQSPPFSCRITGRECDSAEMARKLISAYDARYIDSISICLDSPDCILVEQPMGWGGSAINIRLYGSRRLERVEAEPIMRMVV